MSKRAIPMSPDVMEVIGAYAERVENRSLLLDKFVFHKCWPEGLDKSDSACRWSFVRIAEGARSVLEREAREKKNEVKRSQNMGLEKRQHLEEEASIAESLANIRWENSGINDLVKIRAAHTRNFIHQFSEAYPEKSAIVIARLEGRLAINLAVGLIRNAGICLDRLTGLPYIPGSAVKGVCRQMALQELKTSKEAEQRELFNAILHVFGASKSDFDPPGKGGAGDFYPYRKFCNPCDFKGCISFLPSYPLGDCKVVVDLTNVHYPDYYRRGEPRRLREEKLNPNPFPAVEAGAEFAFCLVEARKAPPETLGRAKSWLEKALVQSGIGAKTAAGYGWFSIQNERLTELRKERAALVRERDEERARRLREEEEERAKRERLAAMSPCERHMVEFLGKGPEEFAHLVQEIESKSKDEQEALIMLLRGEKRDRWKAWKKKKPEVIEKVRNVIKKLGMEDIS